ncbi:MAG: glycosyltransferase family 9 protein [Bacteroidales bacterium]
MPSKTKNSTPRKILAIRLSAIGDVAMTVPSIWSITQNNPDVQVTLVSQGFARNIVDQIPGVLFFEADTKNRHKGFIGLIRLFNDLKRLDNFDAVADLHDVIRSKFIRELFQLKGVRVVKIDKGRNEKKALCRLKNKNLVELKSTFERYADVFQKLNLKVDDSFDYFFREARLSKEISIHLGYKEGNWIGIAPFAKHKGKIYPLDQMEIVIAKLSMNKLNKIILIGGGGEEKTILESWAKKYPNTISIARKYSITDELNIISNLNVLVCMDSANMHFASLVNTPVISIWGATHPFAGFYGWKQNQENAIQMDLNCRPCSVYGNKPCFRKDYACLTRITPETVINKINTLLGQHIN